MLDTTTTDKVIFLRQQHKDWSGADIARELHITRERVRQILSEAKLSTKRIVNNTHSCPTCKTIISSNRVYCNKKCYVQHKFETYNCSGCGVNFKRLKRIVKREALNAIKNKKPFRIFCTRKCFYTNGFK